MRGSARGSCSGAKPFIAARGPAPTRTPSCLHAEVLELRTKPSLPVGERCEDAFGKHPAVEDRGVILRALLNVGREDVDVDGIAPVDAGMRVLGGSSDYLVVDVTDAPRRVRVGDTLAFSLKYGALLAAMISAYVEKVPVTAGAHPGATVTQAEGSGVQPHRLLAPIGLTRAFIHLDRLTHNVRLLQDAGGPAPAVARVKGDAYGHGAPLVAAHLVRLGYRTLGVADVDRSNRPQGGGHRRHLPRPVGHAPRTQRGPGSRRLRTGGVYARDGRGTGAGRRASGRRVAVHLNVDTGMGRVGIRPDAVPAFLERCHACPPCGCADS